MSAPNTSRPKYFVCWENHVDAIVLLANGDLYALKAGWAWRMTLNIEKEALSLGGEQHFRVDQLWSGLPADFDYVFTMPRLERRLEAAWHDAIPGKTIFVKVPQYYVYDNLNFSSSDKMIHWDIIHFVDNRFVFTMHKTALVLVAKVGLIPDSVKSTVGGHSFMFDGVHFPERIGFFEMSIGGVPWLKLKQLIPIETPESNLYLAIFNLGVKGAYYCVFRITNSGMSPCRMEEITSAFSCPPQLMAHKHSNWAQTLFRNSGATLLQVIIFLIGALLGAIWTLLILAANTLQNFEDFYSGNIRLERTEKKSK
ncbi:hypothetical protein TYRP_016037 [Tyrophagus putrescentiae]|nr:hypothetical protein TYRP_016037 [Tyrophagus putrescentiae]